MLYIANQIDSNIRELEGALIRVVAYSSLINKDMNADLAAEALKNIIPNSIPRIISISDIQKAVGGVYQVKLEDFKAKNGQNPLHSLAKLRCIYHVNLRTHLCQK